MIEIMQSHGEGHVGELGAQRGGLRRRRGGPLARRAARHAAAREAALETGHGENPYKCH